jgi:hypothetical protein
MKIEVVKKKPTKLQAFFLRPLTLQQRLQVKLAVLMFRIKTRSKPDQERFKLDEVGCDGLLAEEKLKPCPFCEQSEAKQCGNEPVLSHLGGFIDEDGRKCTNGLAVICPHCLAQGPKMGEKGDAVEAWNERSILS